MMSPGIGEPSSFQLSLIVWLNILLHSGSALTFSQMLFITTQSLPSFVTFGPNRLLPRLKPRQVPLKNWLLQVLVLTSGSLLNNWAFAYKVPLTIQIVFRSAGEVHFFIIFIFSRISLKVAYGQVLRCRCCLDLYFSRKSIQCCKS